MIKGRRRGSYGGWHVGCCPTYGGSVGINFAVSSSFFLRHTLSRTRKQPAASVSFFFSGIIWNKPQVPAPYKPKMKGDDDTSNYEQVADSNDVPPILAGANDPFAHW